MKNATCNLFKHNTHNTHTYTHRYIYPKRKTQKSEQKYTSKSSARKIPQLTKPQHLKSKAPCPLQIKALEVTHDRTRMSESKKETPSYFSPVVLSVLKKVWLPKLYPEKKNQIQETLPTKVLQSKNTGG